MSNTIQVPILPIQDLVFFPHTVIPLILENPTAILIIKDCLDKGAPVAIPFVENMGIFGQSLPKKICGMGYPILLEEAPAHLKILISGLGRVKLGKIVQDLPYPTYEAEILYDSPSFNKEDEHTKVTSTINRLKEILTEWVKTNVSSEEERENFCQNITYPNQVLDYLCMFLIKDMEIKQHLLENTSFISRVRMLDILFKITDPFTPDRATLGIIRDYQSIELTAKLLQ
jgi:ATP-dependent Lon protease